MAKNKFPKMGENMNNMLKQAQKMQQQMENVQVEIGGSIIEVSAGGGAVTVTMSGKKEIKSIKISPEVVDPDDVEMLEDIILAAVNEAVLKANKMVADEMGKITGGISLPGLF